MQRNSFRFLIYQSNMKPNTLFRSKAQNFRSSCRQFRLLPIFQVRIGFVGNAKRRGDDKKGGEGNAPPTHCQILQKPTSKTETAIKPTGAD